MRLAGSGSLRVSHRFHEIKVHDPLGGFRTNPKPKVVSLTTQSYTSALAFLRVIVCSFTSGQTAAAAAADFILTEGFSSFIDVWFVSDQSDKEGVSLASAYCSLLPGQFIAQRNGSPARRGRQEGLQGEK